MIPGYLRRAARRFWRRFLAPEPCPWCGGEHDPREHYPLPEGE